MNRTYKLIAVIGIAAIGLLISKQATAQTTNSKIPFQGSLYDQGTPVNGTNEMVFSITAASWTETHSVQVVNGLYSVVLGSVTPLPTNLFTGVDSQQLAITVAGTSIGSVAIYAPFITPEVVRQNLPDSIYASFNNAAAEHSTINFTVNGTGSGSNTAIKAVASTEGDNRGIKGFALSATSTGGHIGVYGKGEGQGKYNHGIYGLAKGAGNGDEGHGFGEGSINFGVEGNASGNAWNNTGVEGSNYGTEGKFNYGVSGVSSAGTVTSENTGVRGSAFGSGVNRGVYGFADGGTENWAGWFEGDVMVNNAQLKLNNVNGNQAATLRLNAEGGGMLYTYNDFGSLTGWFGNYQAQGGFSQLAGYDGAGNITGAVLNGFWNGTGNNSFMMEDANAQVGANLLMESDVTNNWGSLNLYKNANDGTANNQAIKINGGESRITLFDNVGWESLNLDGRDGSAFFGGDVQFNGSTVFNGTGHFTGDLIVDGNITGNVSGGSPNVTKDITGLIDDKARQTFLTGNVDVSNTTFYQTANYNEAQTVDGNNVAVFGLSNTNSDKWQIGVEGQAAGDGTGPRYGVRGVVQGTATSYSVGVLAYNQVTPPDNATVTGVYGRAFNGATGTENYGVRARAEGTAGRNIGIFAEALNSVDENWAGWFEGDVMVNNAQLKLNNVNGNQAATLRLNAEGGGMLYTYNDFGSNTGWFGNYQAQGGFSQLAGYDGAGNITGAVLNGFWDGTGNARLMMEDENARQMASMNIDDGTGGKAGTLFTYGPNTPNLEMRGKGWEDNDLPTIQMFGQHTDGASWYKTNTIMEVNSDGTANWGNLVLQNSEEGAGRHETTVHLDGSDGSLTLRSPDGLTEFRIDPNGISGGGSATDLTNLNITDTGIMGGQGFASINIVNDGGGADPSGYSAELFLQGTNTPNFQFGGKPWEDNNLPHLEMYGSTSDGGSWFHSNLSMSVDTDGTYEAGNIGLQKTDIAGQTAETTITLDGMNGNIGIIGSISASNFDLNNGVNGYVNMGAKTWEPTNGERRGYLHLSGTEDGLPNNDAQRVFLEVSDNGSGSYGTLGLKNYEDDGGGNGKVTIDLNGENGSIYLSSGAGDITLDGQNGNIGVNGSISAASLDAGSILLDGGSGNMSGINEMALTKIFAGDHYDNAVHINDGAPMVSIWSGGSGADDGTETILLNGDTGDVNITGAFNQISDRRFKNNIETIENALDNTLKMRGVSYNWKDSKKTQKTQIGVIAQEVEEVYPEFVHTKEDGYKAVNYAQMTAVLIEAVKELNAKVEALQGENAELKAELTKVDLLEQKIKRFEELLSGSRDKGNPSSLKASK